MIIMFHQHRCLKRMKKEKVNLYNCRYIDKAIILPVDWLALHLFYAIGVIFCVRKIENVRNVRNAKTCVNARNVRNLRNTTPMDMRVWLMDIWVWL